jgi:TetR/AcrR family transcriptional regulator, ethionamide resistance regulator
MPAPARRPFQIPHSERRQLLTRHLIPVIEAELEDGKRYADLSVEQIINAGGISRATFYAYFEDKGNLLAALAQDVIAELTATGRAWWELPDHATRSDLREALRPPIDAYRSHRAILGAVVETAAYDDRVRAQQADLIDHVVAELAKHISTHQQHGTAAPQLDPKRTAKWLIWMIERGLYQLVSPANGAEAESLLETVTDIVWRTLYDGFRDAGEPAEPRSNTRPR